jgi:hypothetical protein
VHNGFSLNCLTLRGLPTRRPENASLQVLANSIIAGDGHLLLDGRGSQRKRRRLDPVAKVIAGAIEHGRLLRIERHLALDSAVL